MNWMLVGVIVDIMDVVLFLIVLECQYHHKNLLDRIVALVPPTLNS